MDQDGHFQPRHAYAVGHAALVAEVGKADEDTVNLVAMLLEQVRALPCVLKGFNRAVFSFLRSQADALITLLIESAQNFFSPIARQDSGKETTIADNHA